MIIDLACSRPTAVAPSPRVLAVAGMFGLGIDDQKHLQVVPPAQLELTPGSVMLTIGPSGSGKSTILKLIERACRDARDAHGTQPAPVRVINFDDLPPMPQKPLIDCLDDLELDRAMELLSVAGLNDAFVMLRRPCELSDGQRYRFKLAAAFAQANHHADGRANDAADVQANLEADAQANGDADSRANDAADAQANGDADSQADDAVASVPLTVILADEFGATLDRITAKVIARNVAKWTRRSRGVCFVAATTHDDLLEAMDPDVLIEKPLGESLHIWKKGGDCHA